MMVRWSLALLLVTCPTITAIYGPSARKEGVVVATKATFKAEVTDYEGPVAVQFFAPWCGHCKALKPAWKAATKALKDKIKLVVVDATSEGQLAQKYSVRGYPSIQVGGTATFARVPLAHAEDAAVRTVLRLQQAQTADL
jgi:protein disulfide-isomerase A6